MEENSFKQAIPDNSTGVDSRIKDKIHEIFSQVDTDSSGTLAIDEIGSILRKIDPSFPVRNLLQSMDTDSDNEVSFEEFYTFIKSNMDLTDPEHLSLKSVVQQWTKTEFDCGGDFSVAAPSVDAFGWKFAWAGGVGGIVSRTATAPLERIKILQQINSHSGRGALRQIMRSIVSTEGTQGLFVGNMANCLRMFPFAGTVCFTYCHLLERLPTDDVFDPMEPVFRLGAGFLAGAAATTLTYPLDVIRTRVSVFDSAYKNIRDAFVTIAKEEGVSGLYRGMLPTLATMAPFIAIQQSGYDILKQIIMENSNLEPSFGLFSGCAFAAGCMANGITYPMDVIRRNMQITHSNTAVHFRDITKTIFKESGIRGFYAGLATSLMKVPLAVTLSLVVRDALLGRLAK
eukprot:TRINITY_DN3387_c0_g1_i1.p1 TRINITY_DN3387_c0_g1~~TRINITY_DN3387_c0_g1_i1.p1  ORF type:complete len:400 (+),score=109.49 TRINITY_DN3387_c0_g1_i1:177-1376(+)